MQDISGADERLAVDVRANHRSLRAYSIVATIPDRLGSAQDSVEMGRVGVGLVGKDGGEGVTVWVALEGWERRAPLSMLMSRPGQAGELQ